MLPACSIYRPFWQFNISNSFKFLIWNLILIPLILEGKETEKETL